MKKIFSSLIILSLAFFISACSQISPPAPVTSSGVDYRQSSADVVVLSFFDMYCPHCQKNAKLVNELHAMSQRPNLERKVDFYAIGWNNTPLEAEMYRKRYGVSFPVVPDRDRSISSRFGSFRPPLIIALKKQAGQWTEFYRVVHLPKNKESVLAQITNEL